MFAYPFEHQWWGKYGVWIVAMVFCFLLGWVGASVWYVEVLTQEGIKVIEENASDKPWGRG